MTYERGKPSGAMTLFTMLRLVIGSTAARVFWINVKATKAERPAEKSISITGKTREKQSLGPTEVTVHITPSLIRWHMDVSGHCGNQFLIASSLMIKRESACIRGKPQ